MGNHVTTLVATGHYAVGIQGAPGQLQHVVNVVSARYCKQHNVVICYL